MKLKKEQYTIYVCYAFVFYALSLFTIGDNIQCILIRTRKFTSTKYLKMKYL